MQTLHASPLNGVVPVQYPIIQSVARNRWIDVNNESSVTLNVGLGGRAYLIPPNTTARYAMDNTETFVTFTPQSPADPTKDTVSGTIYNEQDSVPVEVERGANASDILPITSAMIADGAVIAAKVATDAINTANIVAGAVGTNQLANGAVTNPILASLAVATGNIQSGAVTNSTLATLAVANSNIQALAVNTAQIADGAVATTKIASLAVTTALIAGAAVGTAQIANAAITTALIANLAVTDALIANLSASKITAGTITAAIGINGPTITGGLFRTATSGQRIEISSTNLDRINLFTGLAGETSPAEVLFGNSLQLVAARFTGATPAQILLYADYLGQVPQTTVEGAIVRLQADAFGAGGVGRSIQMDGRTGGGISIQAGAGGGVSLNSSLIDSGGNYFGGIATQWANGQAPVHSQGVGWFLYGTSITVNKRNAASSITVMIALSCYASGAGGSFLFGINGGNVASQAWVTAFFNTLGQHQSWTAVFRVLTGAAVGNYTFQVGYYGQATTVNTDANDYYSLVGWESA